MLGLFKKKTKKELLQAQYEKLMNESFKLSKVNRAASDERFASAQEILVRIGQLEKFE